jgi:hypothetical protein
VDNDGNALVTGALYYRTTAPIGMKVWDGSQWLEASAAQQASLVTFEYVATAGQTTFSGADANGVTLSYIAGIVMVSVNGVRLRPGDDFTATNGTSVVLVAAAAAGDEVLIDAFRTFEVANTYTQAQVDAALAAKQAADAELTTLAGMSASRATFLAGAEGFGFRNRIINGDMRIDQRNAGASVSGSVGYTLDRWTFDASNPSNFSCQQISDAPAGFRNSVRITTTTAFSATSAQFFNHHIEGLNVADLNWGASPATAVSLSFWVKSSIAGLYSVALTNSANNYAYPATFTVNAANTWEYKTITVAGPTAGTWLATNGVGIRIKFNLNSGSIFESTANTWVAADRAIAPGSVGIGATLNATLQLTGVQLEAGSVATPFERRDYGRELMMCQRYYQNVNYGATWYTGNTGVFIDMEDRALGGPQFFVPMRVTPTVYLTADGGATQSVRSYGGDALRSVGGISVTQFGVASITHGTPYTLGRPYTATWKAEAEL